MVRFTEKLIEACGAALDAGVFYQTAFEKFVLNHMGGFDCEPIFSRILSITPGMNFLKEQRPLIVEFEKEIAALPRGSYGVIQRPILSDGQPIYDTVMSDGSGTPAAGVGFDHYREMPDGSHILSRMVGYEIYECRHYVQKLREVKKDNEAIVQYFLSKGGVFKGFNMPGDNYSTVTIKDIYGDGQIKVELVKKGSRKRWSLTIRAINFVEYANLEKQSEGGINGREDLLIGCA